MHIYTKGRMQGCVQQDRDGSVVRVGSQTWMEIPDGEEQEQGQGYGQGCDMPRMEL